jgi:hypothetical protein
MDGVYIERRLLYYCTAVLIIAALIPLLSNPAHHSTYDCPSLPLFNTSKYYFYKGHL